MVFSGETTLKEMKRTPEELVDYLYRNNSFPHGMLSCLRAPVLCLLIRSRCKDGDEIRIVILPIGSLVNEVG